jgi:hypothetical protein
MTILFKLIGTNDKEYILKYDVEGLISYNEFNELFNYWGLTPEQSMDLKFINPSNIIIFSNDDNEQIYIHSIQYLEHLKNLFDKLYTNTIQPIINKPTDFTKDIINIINDKTLQLFEDDDFKKLLYIYINKPELFNMFSKYIQNGNIINQEIFNNIDDEDEEYYNNLTNIIIQLGLNISQDIILDTLIKCKGHLNLTLRTLLYNEQKE